MCSGMGKRSYLKSPPSLLSVCPIHLVLLDLGVLPYLSIRFLLDSHELLIRGLPVELCWIRKRLNRLLHFMLLMVLREYRTVSKWLGRLADSTAEGYLGIFNAWFKWIGTNGGDFRDLSPDELIEYQKKVDNGSQYEVLDLLVHPYIKSKTGRAGYKRRVYTCIKSFFLHNRVPLPKDATYIIRGDIPKVQGTLSPDEIRRIVLSSNVMYQALFLCMFQGGMGLDELIWWSDNGLNELEAQLRQQAEVIRISLIGRKSRKNDYNYYTFIGEDTIQALRNYIPKRPVGAEAIFIIQNGQAVTKTAIKYYWFRHLKKLGIIQPRKDGPGTRYGKNLHELRDVFRTQWEKSPAAGNVAEYLMGHQIDPLEYNKALRDEKWVCKEYLKALPLLQIMSSGKPFGRVDEDRVEEQAYKIKELEAEVQRLRNGQNLRVENLQAQLVTMQNEMNKDRELLKLLYERLKVED